MPRRKNSQLAVGDATDVRIASFHYTATSVEAVALRLRKVATAGAAETRQVIDWAKAELERLSSELDELEPVEGATS